MRTTLSLDDDVLNAARVLARQQRSSVGQVISELARQGLAGRHATEPVAASRSGLPVLPRRPDGVPVDLELVNQLRDETIGPVPGLLSG
ncbi:CopG family transcriptional regulator [Cyanobium sp. ATX 6A2]|uniref:CopG family transcriptional regulator n=1 Tax=Cyanobium sp. ATX 6A2 TaxID=2823700 RepID=UPI0020CE60E6|nr:CopG family transcriptional regulator [Cyanobium sp. ATX 6A2]MCP9888944.1 CopG family transcriptional regulator [Cyanobium sp. ATX 6A2]